jgi:transposase
MSKKHFTDQDIKNLSNNPNVKSVSSKGITYTEVFKRTFISESENGKLPRQIFEENGFDVEVLGKVRVSKAAYRWRTAYNESGVLGLQDMRKDHSGRPTNKELTLEEKNTRLEAQNHLLKAEIELLKKLEMMERGLERNE